MEKMYPGQALGQAAKRNAGEGRTVADPSPLGQAQN